MIRWVSVPQHLLYNLEVSGEAGLILPAPVLTPTIIGGEECTTGVPEATHFACLGWGGAGALCLILPAG